MRKLKGTLKRIGGSMCDDWNQILSTQAAQSLWFFERTDAKEVRRQRRATINAPIGINPKDEFEGIVAAQLIACHNAAMEMLSPCDDP